MAKIKWDKGQYVRGGSCGELLYFHGEKDKKIIIINSTTNKVIVVPPPSFNPPPYEGRLKASGLGYDAKSGDFKLIRHYVQECFENKEYKELFDLYQFNSFGMWKEPRRPRSSVYNATGVYLVESGSCYWVGCDGSSVEEHLECLTRHDEQRFQEPSDGLLDSPSMHVVSFDFATERFGRLPLPAPLIGHCPGYKLVRYCGLLGALVYDSTCSEMPVELFVWKEKGRSWESVYGVVYLDAEIPLGLKDDRLFLEVEASGDQFNQLMVYDFKTRQSKKLDIYGYPRQISVVCYGAESMDPPLPDSIPKANYDFSRKMRMSNKGKKKKNKKKKKKKKGKGKGKKRCR